MYKKKQRDIQTCLPAVVTEMRYRGKEASNIKSQFGTGDTGAKPTEVAHNRVTLHRV